jgi:hypothetical protein
MWRCLHRQASTQLHNELQKENVMRKTGYRWKGAFLAAAALAFVAGSARTGATAQCGDLNGDGQLGIADAIRLQKAVFAPSSADCGGAGSASCGQVNKQANDPPGKVSGADVVVLQAVLAGNPTLFGLCQGSGTSACPAAGPPVTGAGGETWTSRVTRSGTIAQSEIWPTGCRVDIDGLTFVPQNVTITIQPGALVVGKNPPSPGIGGPTNVSALIFLRNSKINAAGTVTQPILMTSSNHVDLGTGGIGDWGGLSINGNAPVNCPGGECLAEGLIGVPFGGPDPHDSSGVLEFARVEFSGKELSQDNELNIITYNGLGDNTVLDHVQANVGFDDCQEWFGGTVNSKFLVDSGCGDDLFDTQLATTGKTQFMLGVYFNKYMQNAGNNGFEWDNNENGFDLLPRNAPLTCNFTMIGTELQTNFIGENTEQGSNLRRGTAGIITNTIWEHFRNVGIGVTDNATAAQACPPGPDGLVVEHSLLFDNGHDSASPNWRQVNGNWTTPCTATAWYAGLPSVTPADPSTQGTDPRIPVIYGTGVPGAQTDLTQFTPAGTGGVATEPSVNSLAMDCKTIDPFFETTNYIGAFKPGAGQDWLQAPWINFRLQ